MKDVFIHTIAFVFLGILSSADVLSSQALVRLDHAIRSGDVFTVHDFLKNEGPADLIISGWPILTIAADYRKNDIVSLLLDNGADVNMKNINGDTALILAAYNEYLETLAALLRAGADTEVIGSDGESALMWSVEKGDLESVRLLLDNGANIDGFSQSYGTSDRNTPLMRSVANENLEMATLLLNKGASPNFTNFACDSAYTYAMRINNARITELLIQNGASQESSDKCCNEQRNITWLIVSFVVGCVALGVVRSVKSKRYSALRVSAVLLNGLVGLLMALLISPGRLDGNISDLSAVLPFILVVGNIWVSARTRNNLVMRISFVVNAISATAMLFYMLSFNAEEFAMGGVIAIICILALSSTSTLLYRELRNKE